MAGQWPPSSRVIFFKLGATACMICLPVAVEPVKATLATRGCSTKTLPASAFEPVTTLTTPGGIPPSIRARQNVEGERGVTGGGLTTQAQPEASAGPSFQLKSERG